MSIIRKDMIVSLHYTMTNGRGHLLEKTQTTYLHGSSAISPHLQTQLEGLETGGRRTIFLKKGEEGADDDFSFEILIDAVREARPNELLRGTPITPVKIHLLSGFLGSGKTTAIEQACRLLSKKGIATAVITNDQGAQLVDGERFNHLGIPSAQVINGCFCCNYNDLDAGIRSLIKQYQPAVLFAESVGSCTDIVATVLKPLLLQHPEWQPTVSVFADAHLLPALLEGSAVFGPAVSYIYGKQLEEAQTIVVSKIDRIDNEIALHRLLTERYPGKTILYQDSFNEDHIYRWLQTLDETFAEAAALPSLNIDYDLYGEGEAKLAWLDQQLEFKSTSHRAQDAALALMQRLGNIDQPIAHLKFLLDGHTKLSYTSTGSSDFFLPSPAGTATLLINARMQTAPSTLSIRMDEAIRATQNEQDCTIRTLSSSCFQPGYPRPTHRIA